MAELREVTVPDVGDFTDIPVVEVLVGAGDRIAVEDPLVTLESEKASMDVPAPFAGVVAELRVAVGDAVSEGSVLMTVEVAQDGARSGDEAGETAGEAPGAEAVQPGAAGDLGGTEPPAPPEGESRGPRGSAPPTAARPAPQPSGDPAAYAGPGARRRARELGVDLRRVTGTGRKGRILVSDVEAREGLPGGPSGRIELPPWPEVDFAKHGPIERVELSRIKRVAGPNLQRNWITIPHVTHNDEADITELEAFRVAENKRLADQGVKLTMVALLLKACVESLKEFPEVNSSLDGGSLILKRYYHLGFAADTPRGLVVPVIRDVDRKGLEQIAAELAELSGRARDGKLGPAQMSGGTFTISSLGGIGGTSFTPIVNAPEVAILGVTRAVMRPVWDGSEFQPRLVLPLSLSYDHRVIDGAAAARFTVHLAGVLMEASFAQR